jgi:hypothetical protein
LRADLPQVVAHEDILRFDFLRKIRAGLLPDDSELFVAIPECELIEMNSKPDYLPEKDQLLLK